MSTKARQSLPSLKAFAHWQRALEVCQRLHGAGFVAYVAGGSVRDACLGRIPHDVDIATNATPDQVEQLFERTLAIGKSFGVVIVVFPECQFEVATFRADGAYVDGRHPMAVTWSGAEGDAQRRDFTVNALFYDPASDRILDFVDGLKDLKRRRLRAVGQARERFQEDRLRLLRTVRFAVQLNFEIEPQTWRAVQAEAPQVTAVSVERIFHEISRICTARQVAHGFELLRSSGLLAAIWPALEEWSRQQAEWQRLLRRLEWLAPAESLAQAWAAMALSVGEDRVTSRLKAWKSPAHLQKEVSELFRRICILQNPRASVVEQLLALGGGSLSALVSLWWAERLTQGQDFRAMQALIDRYLKLCGPAGELPAPLLTGQDLIQIGFVPGPQLGAVLKEIFQRQVAGEMSSKKEALVFAKAQLSNT